MVKILYIAEKEVLEDGYKDAFLDEGYRVDVASTVTDALVAAEKKPNLILLDINLHGSRGLSVLKKLKQQDQTQHIPIIILTEKSVKDDDVEKAVSLGAVSYIEKSKMEIKDVVRKVREILGGYVSESTMF